MKRYCLYLVYVCVATLWIAITVVLPDFFDNPITGLRGVITISLYVVALSIVSWLWLYIASLNKYVAAVFVPLYGMIGATVSYYRVMYRVTITPLMLDCILHTNMEEALGVISWSLIVWVGANLLIGIALVIWRWRLKKPKYAWLHALVVLVIFVGYYHINGRLHQSIN